MNNAGIARRYDWKMRRRYSQRLPRSIRERRGIRGGCAHEVRSHRKILRPAAHGNAVRRHPAPARTSTATAQHSTGPVTRVAARITVRPLVAEAWNSSGAMTRCARRERRRYRSLVIHDGLDGDDPRGQTDKLCYNCLGNKSCWSHDVYAEIRNEEAEYYKTASDDD